MLNNRRKRGTRQRSLLFCFFCCCRDVVVSGLLENLSHVVSNWHMLDNDPTVLAEDEEATLRAEAVLARRAARREQQQQQEQAARGQGRSPTQQLAEIKPPVPMPVLAMGLPQPTQPPTQTPARLSTPEHPEQALTQEASPLPPDKKRQQGSFLSRIFKYVGPGLPTLIVLS